ncbi:uncharacterized protein LOC127868545 isoform X2 [Dreissena polymorpha]|uniref:uncharacterized protein LOC127868545 isoform X1 n=1 Tax=Dreissena polymorpha TaxID=45954 RepID=UPI00226502EE|nr:uncharacterized protein LOC127868545 isoform X1 [Dreissena polymorpha]XP_052266373.1 uncharacterized protein LOC127868545 isoform X2 [Dreissena polymorpha]
MSGQDTGVTSISKKTSLKFDSSIAFQVNTDIEQYLTKQFGIGKILHRAVQGDANNPFTVTKKCQYDLKIPTDGTTSYYTGICVTTSDYILVADHRNNRVKLLNQQYKVISHCDVPVSEGEMCQISASEVAVTVSDGVQFISVANIQLVKGTKLQFQHHCTGIAHHEGNLYVTSGTALYQYTKTGALVQKIYEDTTASSTVVGHVLVCGYSSRTIIQVDREGKTKLATLWAKKDVVIYPVSVCYNSDTHTVILAELTPPAIYRNNRS